MQSLSTSDESKIKYALVTRGASYFPSLLKPEIERAGLYNWIKVFDGEVLLWKHFESRADDLKSYDVIHVNLAGGDFGLATEIRNALGSHSKTRLVTNMDYSVHYFNQTFKGLEYGMKELLSDLHASDMVFGVEPKQIALLNFMMKIAKKTEETGRSDKAALIPHPVNVELMSKPMPEGLFAPYDNRGDILAYQYHRYDGHWEIARLLMHNLPPPGGEGNSGVVMRALLGYTDSSIKYEDMPDMVLPFLPWAKYIYFLSTCLWGMEYRTHSAASRFILECASLGIPVVSTDYSYLGKEIFPDLSFPMDDYDGMRAALEKLIVDDSYRIANARHGLREVGKYGFINSKRRYITELNKRCEEKEELQ
jgi:hypothetical protein